MAMKRRHSRIRLRIVALLKEHPDGLTSDGIRGMLKVGNSVKSIAQILDATPGVGSFVSKVHDFVKQQDYHVWVLDDEERFNKWIGGGA